jgi:hypothetical protein
MHDPTKARPPSIQGTATDPPREDLFPPPSARASLLWRTLMGVSGVLLIVIGLALAVLPIVPGFPLIAVGVLMLVAANEPSRRLVNRGVRHLPRSAFAALKRVLAWRDKAASK